MIRASDYGRALFELARQEHREGEIGEEMAGVRAILSSSRPMPACWIPLRCPGSSGFPWWRRPFPV